MKITQRILFFLLLLAMLCLYKAYSQAPEQYNRFQYHKYTWKVLTLSNSRICFPAGYDSLASFISVQLPGITDAIKKSMGVPVKAVPNIIIYPSIDQLYESNIGLYDQGGQPFPTIYLKGRRMLLAFDGSYARFREQLAEAWARMAWQEQFQNDLEEQVLPKQQLTSFWFSEGAIAFFAHGWRIADEDALLAAIGEMQSWSSVEVQAPRLAGQAFCYFLSQRYREDAAKQILFQIRKGKSPARAVRLIAKRPLDTLTTQCLAFFKERLPAVAEGADTLKDHVRSLYKKGHLLSFVYSADHKQVAYVIARDHKRSLYLGDAIQVQQQSKAAKAVSVYRLPPWLSDLDADPYPLLHWSVADHKLYTVAPEKGWVQVHRYTATGQYLDRRKLYGVDGINVLNAWSKDQWLLSAYRRAKSDIVLYNATRLRFTPLTDDLADNTEPAADPQHSLLLYRSGYPADSLYHPDSTAKAYGIYAKAIPGDSKNAARQRDKLLWKDTAYISWYNPALPDDNTVNLQHTVNGNLQQDTVTLQQAGKTETLHQAPSAWLKDYRLARNKKDSLAALERKWKEGETSSFLGGVLKGNASKGNAERQRDSLLRALAYTPAKVKPYLLQLYSAYFSARVNNDYYINRLQPYQAYLGTFKFPDIGAMVRGGFSDLFDNHHFNIGYRMPAGSEGSDFFFRYENTARRLDWHLLFFRKVESLQPDAQRDWKDEQGRMYPQLAKVRTHYYEWGVHYPIRYDWSLDFTAAARRDRTVFLSTDRYSLNFKDLKQWWSINTVSTTISKLHPLSPFLYQGWDARLLGDVMVATGKHATLLYAGAVQFSYHQPLYRDINLVLRGNAACSGGQSRILYNFGGVDNNVVPRVDTAVRFKQEAPYAFQSLVTPFRGYPQNSLYGSSYVLFNADLYVPLFQRLIPLQTRISALDRLQLGLFTDIAATGRTHDQLPAAPSHLQSFGFSARTLLAGYPLRFDLAWPQQGFSAQPVWYLSFCFK